MPKCRITVLKRMLNEDLAKAYLNVEEPLSACGQFREGQEFLMEEPYQMPEGFCAWAWADIRGDVTIVFAGGDPPWIKQRGTIITGCTDWFRPVLFKVERVE